MKQLSELIDILERLSYGNPENVDPACNCVKAGLEKNRIRISSTILEFVASEVASIYEVQQYGDLLVALKDALRSKLKYNDRDFLDISGIRLNKSTCELEVVDADFSSLGTYNDWLAMQRSAWFLFSERKDRSPEQRAISWKMYYNAYGAQQAAFEAGVDVDIPSSNVYPAIMRTRLQWARSRELAPYWYWYDQSVETSLAYPQQQPTHFSDNVKWEIENAIYRINETCKIEESGGDEDIVFYISDRGVEEYIGELLTGWGQGNFNIEPSMKMFVGSGKLHGRTVSSSEVIKLIKNGTLKISRAYGPEGNEVHLYDAKGGGFTGISGYVTGLSGELDNR